MSESHRRETATLPRASIERYFRRRGTYTPRTDFDAHAWFERYAATHNVAPATDPMRGVPFS